MRRASANSAVATVLATLLVATSSCTAAPEAEGLEEVAPYFEVDPLWMPRLPDTWILGEVRGLFVDSRQHLWVLHMPNSLTPRELYAAADPPIAECCIPAPSVLELDLEGNVLQSWGGPGEGYEWPANEHGIFVDHNDFVWLGAERQHQIMKFTRDGRHILTIGDPERTGGSNDVTTLGGPASFYVDPETNEIFVADGYRNRRVIVFDAETGEYRRHWGAYGNPPDDDYEIPERGGENAPSRQFSTVHGLAVSYDGLVYVADRFNSRVQVFRKDGEFVAERLVAPETLGSGTGFHVAFSHDPEQEFLFYIDGTNNKVWILRRESLEILDSFGRAGRQAGQFMRAHKIVVDAAGNLYTGEALNGNRVQRWLFRGYRPV